MKCLTHGTTPPATEKPNERSRRIGEPGKQAEDGRGEQRAWLATPSGAPVPASLASDLPEYEAVEDFTVHYPGGKGDGQTSLTDILIGREE
jgi:hypothetical protein